MSTQSNHPQRAEINRVAKILMDAWARAEPEHNVTKYPVSYIATFADMARAVVEDRELLECGKAVYAGGCMWAECALPLGHDGTCGGS